MTSPDPWLARVAALYDSKRRDFNWRLASDGIVHHHNGLVADRASFLRRLAKASPAAAERMIHDSETALSKFGFRYLGRPRPGSSLLDAGCGRGGSSLLLAERYPALAVRGVTLSGYQASAARIAARARGLSGRVRFSKASMLDLPFGRGSFDLVWACESTEHVPALPIFFSETARVARPGARLVVIAWTRNSAHRLGRRYAGLADKAYITKIHSREEYLGGAAGSGWRLRLTRDLTGQTAAYWEARAALKNAAGTESFMAPAFASRALLYILYSYELPR